MAGAMYFSSLFPQQSGSSPQDSSVEFPNFDHVISAQPDGQQQPQAEGADAAQHGDQDDQPHGSSADEPGDAGTQAHEADIATAALLVTSPQEDAPQVQDSHHHAHLTNPSPPPASLVVDDVHATSTDVTATDGDAQSDPVAAVDQPTQQQAPQHASAPTNQPGPVPADAAVGLRAACGDAPRQPADKMRRQNASGSPSAQKLMPRPTASVTQNKPSQHAQPPKRHWQRHPHARQQNQAAGSAAPSTQHREPRSPKAEPGINKRKNLELRRVTSKRYRDSLGNLYRDLENLIPAVFPQARPRTKSQIIDYTGHAVRMLRQEVAKLDARYVFSSACNRNRWVEKVATTSLDFPDAVSMLMRLLVLRGWTYTEMWAPRDFGRSANAAQMHPLGAAVAALEQMLDSSGPHQRPEFELRSCHGFYGDEGTEQPLEISRFSNASRQMSCREGDDSIIGKTIASQCAEWYVVSPDIAASADASAAADAPRDQRGSTANDDENADVSPASALPSYIRRDMVAGAGFRVTCALPVLLRGRVCAVVALYCKHYTQDIRSQLGITQDLAAAIGNAYGALRDATDILKRPPAVLPAFGLPHPYATAAELSSATTPTLSPVGVAISSGGPDDDPLASISKRGFR